MYAQSNDTVLGTITQSSAGQRHRRAFWLCFLGVLGFSFTLPATRLAAPELDPLILGPGRSLVAGVIALAIIALRRWPVPTRKQRAQLALVALGIAFGFPLFTALALGRVPAHHAVLIVALAPLLTSAWAAWRHGERLPWHFWAFAFAGAFSVVLFARFNGVSRFVWLWEDAYLCIAVLLVAVAYAEGGKLAVSLGGTRVICWAFVLALPCSIVCVAFALAQHTPHTLSAAASFGFLYVAIVSSMLAFSLWYQGLALGGVSYGSQVQLLQPLLSVLWCAAFLGESISPRSVLCAATVLLCAAGSRWSRTRAR